MSKIDYSGWDFNNLISQINLTYTLLTKGNKSKGQGEIVIEIGAMLCEIRERFSQKWKEQKNELPFIAATAYKYCSLFEKIKKDPTLYKELLESSLTIIYEKLGLGSSNNEKECDRTNFVVPNMREEELRNFYIAYLILGEKNNNTIQRIIQNIWRRKDFSKEIQSIRGFISQDKDEIDEGVRKAVLYAIKIYNYE